MNNLEKPGLFATQQKMVMRLMNHWQLTDAQRASVLALGNTEQEQQAVFEQLLAIHKMLRLLFPANRELAYRWVTIQNAAWRNVHRTDSAPRQARGAVRPRLPCTFRSGLSRWAAAVRD